MKIQSTMQIRATFVALYITFAAARMLRGDREDGLVNTMETVTDLVHSLGGGVRHISAVSVQKALVSGNIHPKGLQKFSKSKIRDAVSEMKAATAQLHIEDEREAREEVEEAEAAKHAQEEHAVNEAAAAAAAAKSEEERIAREAEAAEATERAEEERIARKVADGILAKQAEQERLAQEAEAAKHVEEERVALILHEAAAAAEAATRAEQEQRVAREAEASAEAAKRAEDERAARKAAAAEQQRIASEAEASAAAAKRAEQEKAVVREGAAAAEAAKRAEKERSVKEAEEDASAAASDANDEKYMESIVNDMEREENSTYRYDGTSNADEYLDALRHTSHSGEKSKGRACDAELCKARQQAKCDAMCTRERDEKRWHSTREMQRMQDTREKHGNGTAVAHLATSNAGTLYADDHVWQIWDGLYQTHLGYIRDCFGYSVGLGSELKAWHAEISSSAGTAKSFEVTKGQERIGLCYAIYYIGDTEDQSTTSCPDYQTMRQQLCPECCDATANEQGCTGGCSA